MADQKKRPAADDEWETIATSAPSSAPAADEWETVAAEPAAKPKSVLGFLENLGPSAYNLAANTVKGTAGMLSTAAQFQQNPTAYLGKLAADPTVQAMVQNPGKVAGAAKDYLGSRYGGVSELANTAYEDPFGLAADAATVASLGGGAAGRVPGVVGRVGRGVEAFGAAIDPIANVGRAAIVAAAPARRAAEGAGEFLNRSALNVPAALRKANPGVNFPRELAETGLTISPGGAAKSGMAIADRENQVGRLMAGSTATTNAGEWTAPLRELLEQRRGNLPGTTLNAEAPAVDAHVQRIFEANTAPPLNWQPNTPPARAVMAAPPGRSAAASPQLTSLRPPPEPPMPVHDPSLIENPIQQAHSNKVDLGKRIKWGSTETPINVELMRNERKGMMQAEGRKVPEVVPINQELSTRYAVDDALAAALERQSTMPKTLRGAIDSPFLKSLAARELFRMGRSATPLAAGLEQAGPTLTRLAVLQQLMGGDPNAR